VAAANPAIILALLAENESLQRDRTDWQSECLKKGFEYVRESDAHYVLADAPEMAALLGQLLGVEVRSKDNDDYGETVSSLSEQMEACNSVYGRAYDLEKENESLKAQLDKAIEFQPIGEACLTNRDELRASLGLKRGDNLHEHVEALRKDSDRYLWLLRNWFTMSSEYKDEVIFLTGRARWSDLPEDAVSDAIDAEINKESTR
jgi:hypothetical protein